LSVFGRAPAVKAKLTKWWVHSRTAGVIALYPNGSMLSMDRIEGAVLLWHLKLQTYISFGNQKEPLGL
jgi:hypothetical protein